MKAILYKQQMQWSFQQSRGTFKSKSFPANDNRRYSCSSIDQKFFLTALCKDKLRMTGVHEKKVCEK